MKLIKQTNRNILPEMAVSTVSTRTSTTERRPVSSSRDKTKEDRWKSLEEQVRQLTIAVQKLQVEHQKRKQNEIDLLITPVYSPRPYPVNPVTACPSMVNEIPLSHAASSYFYNSRAQRRCSRLRHRCRMHRRFIAYCR